ncbi:Cytochrome P450 monooxygenase sdnE [Fulvia fulva]|uniref:Cytochrome P450 monooxygenase sdnE n=1 Tax=Passalora fulva TaxID=5499 RepID=A0A9Q8P820_PASFU|nr:Cytochrome P450 monooxygenase sdnE [Fulvia fulva]KAK4616776.1 Cytochrome P450 monooxygenase sdnE [Fulvia fulva]UJO16618.1 Cytochrome P450 monooxygenase sdnE [Fulvia fulva]
MASTHDSAATIVALWFVKTVVTVVFRLAFHPLANFPGPKIAAVTSLYEFYYDVVRPGQYTWVIKKMHERHGPIVRISPRELHIDDYNYYDELYSGKKDKWDWAVNMFGRKPGTFRTVKHVEHRARRAALNPFFSKRAAVQLSPMITGHVENMCRRMEHSRDSGQPLCVPYMTAALTLDVITEYAFGRSDAVLDEPDFAPQWLQIMEGLLLNCHLNCFFPWLQDLMSILPRRLAQWLDPRVVSFIRYQGDRLSQLEAIFHAQNTKSATSAPTHGATIFHHLLESPDVAPADRNMEFFLSETMSIVGAGQATTASHISITLFYVLSDHRIYSLLKAELKKAIPNPAILPSLAELEELEYLTAVVAEGHRMSHGAIHRHQRISPHASTLYKDWVIPPGTPIGMSALFMHENEDLFPLPKVFDPSRFLGPEGQRLRKYLVHYSRGPRNCVGQNLAQAEIYLALAAMARRFDFEIFETMMKDMEITRDCQQPFPKKGAKRFRVLVK